MNDSLIEYFRCPDRFIRFAPKGPGPASTGFFQFGGEATCYGTYSGRETSDRPTSPLIDASSDVETRNGTSYLAFDPSQVISNLRCETYIAEWRGAEPMSALARVYYFFRPFLPVSVRRLLQRFHLRGWDKLSFPHWPLDCSVDSLLQQLLLLSVKSNHGKPIPFIWFWPNAAPSAAIMTHDVETDLGRDFCPTLMDIDDSFGIKSSFQIVPEERYGVSKEFLDSVRRREFEVVVHDLNHDGHLYRDRQQFQDRAAKINAYGKEFGAKGFRAGILYRKQLWYDALKFSYDMSIPNVAHLDPQHGGCCTVMPYFLGDILELPVTTTQDYTLFHILDDYSIDLWKRQLDLIMQKHGLISFIVHPDYIVESREQKVYKQLLGYLAQLRKEKAVWITTPGEVDRWWRERAQMKLVEDGDGWQIAGPGKERARIAYASEKNGQLVFTLPIEANQESDVVKR